jgi:hypothetical protein
LLIVMLLLLGISTLAAALVPPPEQGENTESSTSTPRAATPKERPRGDRVAAQVSARGGRRPERVRVSAGDQLALVVETPRPGEIAVPAFGLIEFAEPGAPARFDILIERDGRFEVTADRAGTVARIVATERRSVSPEARPDSPRR